jgi:hypothetical protein
MRQAVVRWQVRSAASDVAAVTVAAHVQNVADRVAAIVLMFDYTSSYIGLPCSGRCSSHAVCVRLGRGRLYIQLPVS